LFSAEITAHCMALGIRSIVTFCRFCPLPAATIWLPSAQ
jgi:hypothetical protein